MTMIPNPTANMKTFACDSKDGCLQVQMKSTSNYRSGTTIYKMQFIINIAERFGDELAPLYNDPPALKTFVKQSLVPRCLDAMLMVCNDFDTWFDEDCTDNTKFKYRSEFCINENSDLTYYGNADNKLAMQEGYCTIMDADGAMDAIARNDFFHHRCDLQNIFDPKCDMTKTYYLHKMYGIDIMENLGQQGTELRFKQHYREALMRWKMETEDEAAKQEAHKRSIEYALSCQKEHQGQSSNPGTTRNWWDVKISAESLDDFMATPPTKQATSSNNAGLLEEDLGHLNLPASASADFSPNSVVALIPKTSLKSASADMKKVHSGTPTKLGGILGNQQRTTPGGKRRKTTNKK